MNGLKIGELSVKFMPIYTYTENEQTDIGHHQLRLINLIDVQKKFNPQFSQDLVLVSFHFNLYYKHEKLMPDLSSQYRIHLDLNLFCNYSTQHQQNNKHDNRGY